MKIDFNVENIDLNEWSNFVINHEYGSIFQTPEFFSIYQSTKYYEPIVAFAIENNSLVGILLGVIQKEKNGIIGNLSSRFVVIGGPLVKNDEYRIKLALLNEVNKKVENRTLYTQIRNIYKIKDIKPFYETGFSYDPHLNIIIDIDRPFNNLQNYIHYSRLKNYKKSLKKGCFVRELNNIDEVIKGYSLLTKTYNKNKIPLPDISHFISIYNILYKKNRCWFLGAFLKNEMIGFRITLNFKDRIYDYYAGWNNEFSNFYPNDIILIELLKKCCESPFKFFDFGGAGKPNIPYGVRDYKLNFGNNLVEYGRFQKINKFILYKFARIGFKLWQMIN